MNFDPVLEGVAGCKRTSGWAVAGEEWRALERRAGRGVGAFMEGSKLLSSTRRIERDRGETGLSCTLLGLLGEKET